MMFKNMFVLMQENMTHTHTELVCVLLMHVF